MRPSTLFRYTPPPFTIPHLPNPPTHRLHLANLPTPIHTFPNILPYNATLHLKRDDTTGGIETGGNKIRKLEFLLADALSKNNNENNNNNYDTVVTIGGIQSNHCRATAAACRSVNLEPHLILRGKHDVSDDLTGNLIVDRCVGARVYRVTPGEYGRIGQEALVEMVCETLRTKGRRPYGIPVGGSNALGTWGYVEAASELVGQMGEEEGEEKEVWDHVVLTTGSGGTLTGLVLGLVLGMERVPKIHAVGVCDDPDYFYKIMGGLAEGMGFRYDEAGYASAEDFFRKHVVVYQGKGLGYAVSTTEELDFITEFSRSTGVLLDPVYTGKALYHFVNRVMPENEEEFRSTNILFWHTGGALGLYDKGKTLLEGTSLKEMSTVEKLDVYGILKTKGNI